MSHHARPWQSFSNYVLASISFPFYNLQSYPFCFPLFFVFVFSFTFLTIYLFIKNLNIAHMIHVTLPLYSEPKALITLHVFFVATEFYMYTYFVIQILY